MAYDLGALEAGYQQQLKQQPQQTAQPKAGGNFFTHLLPSIGGTIGGVGGGALGGAAAGSVILPGVGTAIGGLLGALLGGAGGGAIGKVAENKVEGQALGNGVAGSALENGVLSAGPLRLLKGAGAGAKALIGAGDAASQVAGDTALQGGGRLADALNAAGAAATKPGILRSGLNTAKQTATDRSMAGFGAGVGDKLNGQVITPKTQATLQDFITNRAPQYGGITATTPIQQAAQAQAVHNNVISTLGDKLGQINRAVTPEDTHGIAQAMQSAASKNPALAGSNLAPLSSIAQQVTGATDLKGLEAARMAADKLAYPNGTDLASSQLAQQGAHARDAIDQFVSKAPVGATPEQAQAIAEYKAVKGDYGNSKNVLDLISQANAGAKGVHIPLLGGDVGGQVLNGARNKANAALAGDTTAATNPFALKGVATRDLGAGLVGALTSAQSGANQLPIANAGTGGLAGAINNASTDPNATDPTTSDVNNPFSLDNIKMAIAQDIQTTGGKNIATLTSLYNTFGKPDAAAQALTTNQKNEVVSQQKALESLSAYTSQLNSAGGPEGPLQGAINGSILGNYTNPAAKGIDAQRIDVASAIAGSLNPRGTVSPVTARIISEALPSIHDSPQVAQSKIANLIAQIKAGQYSADTNVGQLVANNTAGQ